MIEIKNIIRSKPVKYLAILVILIAIILRLTAQLVGAEKYRLQIINQIEKATSKNVTITNKLDLRTIPMFNIAKIIIPGISLSDKLGDSEVSFISEGTITLTISLLDFYFGKVNLKELEIENANINLVKIHGKESNFKNWSFIKASEKSNSKFTSVKNITVKNSKVSFTDNLTKKLYTNVYLDIDLSTNPRIVGSLTSDGNIDLKVDTTIKPEAEDSYKINAIIEADGLKSKFNAVLSENNDQYKLIGDFSNSLSKPVFMKKIIGNIAPFLNKVLRDDFKDPVIFNGKIEIDNDMLLLNEISYDSIRTKANGSIRRKFSDDSYDINLKITSADISDFIVSDSDLSSKFVESNPSEDSNTKTGYLNFSLIDNEKVNINLSIDKLDLQKITLKNLVFQFNALNGEVNNGNIGFEIENEFHKTQFKLSNFNFKKIDDTNLLLGNFSNQGNNISETIKMLGMDNLINISGEKLKYDISSKIIISPKEISFFEIDGKIGDSGTFSGSLASTHDDINHYNVDLTFKDLHLENISMPLFKERILALVKNSDSEEYLSYFRWFRTLDSSYRLKLLFQNTEFNGQKIKSLKTICKLLPGNMLFMSDLDSDFADGNYRIELSATQIKPSLNVQVNSLNLDFNNFKNVFIPFLDVDNQTNTSGIADPNEYWSNKNLNLFRLHKYNAKFDLSVIALKVNNLKFDNFRVIGHTSNKVVYFDNLYGELFDGQAQAQGNISFYDQIVYQFSFNTASLDLKSLNQNIFPNLSIPIGKLSTTGSIVTQGETAKDIAGNLVLSAKIASPSLTVDNMDFDSVVDVALKRQVVDKSKVFETINGYFNSGSSELTDLTGSLTASKGLISSNDILFKTRFTNAVLALSIDLNNLTLSSNCAFYFAPYSLKSPISFNVITSGDLRQKVTTTFDQSNLIKYIKWQYDIITAEDIEAAKKKAEEERNQLNQDPDNKDYLFYKLEQQNTSGSSGKDISKGSANENNTSSNQPKAK